MNLKQQQQLQIINNNNCYRSYTTTTAATVEAITAMEGEVEDFETRTGATDEVMTDTEEKRVSYIS